MWKLISIQSKTFIFFLSSSVGVVSKSAKLSVNTVMQPEAMWSLLAVYTANWTWKALFLYVLIQT